MVRPQYESVGSFPCISHHTRATRVHFSPVVTLVQSQLRYPQEQSEYNVESEMNSIHNRKVHYHSNFESYPNQQNDQRYSWSDPNGQIERVRIQQFHRPSEEKVQKVLLTFPCVNSVNRRRLSEPTFFTNPLKPSKLANEHEIDCTIQCCRNNLPDSPIRNSTTNIKKADESSSSGGGESLKSKSCVSVLANGESKREILNCTTEYEVDNKNKSEVITDQITENSLREILTSSDEQSKDSKHTSWKSGLAQRFSLLRKFVAGSGDTNKEKHKKKSSKRKSSGSNININDINNTYSNFSSPICKRVEKDVSDSDFESVDYIKQQSIVKEKTPYVLQETEKSSLNKNNVNENECQKYENSKKKLEESLLSEETLSEQSENSVSAKENWIEKTALPKPSPRLRKFLFRSNYYRPIEGIADATDELSANVEKILEEIADLEHIMENSPKKEEKVHVFGGGEPEESILDDEELDEDETEKYSCDHVTIVSHPQTNSALTSSKPPLPPSRYLGVLRNNFFQPSSFDAGVKKPKGPLKARHKLMSELDVKLSEFRNEVHRSREEIARSYPKLEEVDKEVRNSMTIDRFGRNPQNSRISTSWESSSSTFSSEKNPSSSRHLRYAEQKLLEEWSSIISEAKTKLAVSTKNYNNEGTPNSNNFNYILETDLDTGTSRELFVENDTNLPQFDCSRKPEEVVKSPPTTKKSKNSIVKLVQRSTCSMQNLNLEASSQISTLSPCDPSSKEDRSRSMEFLDDEKNAHLLPPENTLKKSQESRQASEHELRIQRSLQRLNVPDWYKKYATPSSSPSSKPPDKEFGSSGLAGGWSGLSNSKTSSLTSLQSAGRYTGSRTHFSSRHKSTGTASTGGRSSRESLMSPSSTASASPSPYYDRSSFTYGMPYALSRFATARMSCGASPASLSPSPSPVGGITSSTSTPVSSGPMSRYGYNKTPYLGWRSQERLTSKTLYRSPAERLAADIHAQKQKVATPVSESERQVTASNISIVTSPRKESASDLSLNTSDESNSNKLNRVRSSIKEVSNAIVDYVNETKPLDDGINGRASPRRGLIWLESSFVGTKPIDSPGTPDTPSVIMSSGRHLGSQGSTHHQHGKRSSLKLDEQNGDRNKDASSINRGSDTSQAYSSYLSRNEKMGERSSNSSSVSSPTLEDILDSLLALRRPHKKIRSRGKGHKESLSTTETEGLSSSVEPTATVMTSEQPSSNPYETPISDWQERMNQPLDDSAYFPADTDSFMLTSTSGSNNEENKYEKISSYSSAFNENKNAKYHISEENDKGESEPVVVVTKVVASTYGFEIGEDNNDNDDMQERIAQEQETSFGIPTEITNIVNNPLAGLSMDPTNPPTPARLRRVSFDLDISDKDEKSSSRSRRDESIGGSIQCRNSKCAKTATGLEARREFKTCHNCNAYYCCRECRRIHWEKHKKVCMQSRVGQLCKQIIGHVKEDSFVVSQLSTVAKRGFLAKGRGCVKLFFSSPDRAERFLTGGLPELPEPWYIPHSDMLPEEMGAPTFSELSENCRSYNPDTRFVLYASVCVVNEVPTSGAVKWEREMISRSAKIRLLIPRSYDETQPHHHAANPAHLNAEDIDIQTFSPAFTSADDESTIENSTENETLILRSVPTPASLKLNSNDDRRRREVSFTNIQKHLIERGVDLRRTYPDIYSKLCNYVENDEPFLPVTIYPRNSSTGCQFMCVIMPESSDTTDGFSSDPSRKVETINISEH